MSAIFHSPSISKPQELRAGALMWLSETDAQTKANGVMALAAAWKKDEVRVEEKTILFPDNTIPGRPVKPELVTPLAVKHRSMRTPEGRAALIHALTHIEFNAINLALDAIWRYSDMPQAFYVDWLWVAAEEALHFSLLAAHLKKTYSFEYGDFSAHNSLWDMAEKTKGDVLARIALVPRTMEARGLDASPPVRAKLAQAGDIGAAEILDIILRDEIGHVAVGNRWFNWLCTERALDPITTYAALAAQYKAPTLRGPFNIEARQAAGFSQAELDALKQGAATLSP